MIQVYSILPIGDSGLHSHGSWVASNVRFRIMGTSYSEGASHLYTMAVTIFVPGVLRSYCQGAAELSLAASSVRAALEEIERSYPALYSRICDETGAVRPHVNLFVNSSHMRDREGLDTALGPGDVVTIMPAVSGG